MKFAFIGNGTYFNCKHILKSYDVIIALDGGANHCRRMSITPHYSIGDGDSITTAARTTSYQLDKNQNTTDLQKGLQLCKKIAGKKLYTIDLFCCTSETRPDHTQAAMQALMHLPFIKQLYTPTASIQCLSTGQSLQYTKAKDATVSLIPVSKAAKVALTGFAWSGTITLSHNTRSGISNTIKNSTANITVLSGKVFVIKKKTAPRSPKGEDNA